MPHGPLQRYNRDAVRADQDVGLLVSRSRNSLDLKRTPLPPHYRRKPVSTAGVGPGFRRDCEMFDPANFEASTLGMVEALGTEFERARFGRTSCGLDCHRYCNGAARQRSRRRLDLGQRYLFSGTASRSKFGALMWGTAGPSRAVTASLGWAWWPNLTLIFCKLQPIDAMAVRTAF